jgi:pSer/pThr/pTyr-binding forkhead associated (FHA) protein
MLLVGRDPTAQIRLTDARASRRHVEIIADGAAWTVRDLGATNPTHVLNSDGSQYDLRGSTRLSAGQLRIGNAVITLYPLG